MPQLLKDAERGIDVKVVDVDDKEGEGDKSDQGYTEMKIKVKGMEKKSVSMNTSALENKISAIE